MRYFALILPLFVWIEGIMTRSNEYTYSTTQAENYYQMYVTQDGPVTLDIPITFVANLTNGPNNRQFQYIFQDNADPVHHFSINGSTDVSLSVAYPDKIYSPGEYVMTVTCVVVLWEGLALRVASASVPFEITEYIPGRFDIAGVSKRYDKLYAGTGDSVNMSVTLQLPDRVFRDSELTYSWTINRRQIITSKPFITRPFKKAGSYNIRVAIVARITLYDEDSKTVKLVRYKWGYFNDEIEIKDPFSAINLTGNTYLKHGELFNIQVSCNGSGPFEYCWKVVKPLENLTDFTCLSPVVTTTCSFPIVYYFNPSGDYHIAILIDNYVSSMQRELDVHIYDVSLKPQLSTVIMPILCSVIVIFIIAAGVMLHVRRNQKVDIETADFDFLQSETCAADTFWERLYHSIIRTFCLRAPVAQLHVLGSSDSRPYSEMSES